MTQPPLRGSHLRGVVRAVAFVVWTLAVGGAWLCLRPFLRGADPEAQAQRTRGGARVLALWSRGLCVLLGIRVTSNAEGDASVRANAASVTAAPRLIVSNHIGYLDVIVLASLGAVSSSRCPALFVSKDDLARWPVMGPLGRSVGTLFLERGRPRAVAEVSAGMRRAFDRGASVIVFPEGTTTRGDTVQEFHTALFEPAVRAGVPVQAAFLTYDAPDLAAWTGDASFVPHLYRLFCARGIEAQVALAAPAQEDGDRRAVAAATRDWMEGELRRIAGRSSPTTAGAHTGR